MANEHLREKHFWFAHYFGSEVADRYCLRPMLNAGAFALSESSPNWEAYRDRLAKAMKVERMDYGDRMSLNLAVWRMGGEAILPARHNWLCNSAFPMHGPAAKRLVDHYYPHEPLGIVHLAGPDKLGKFSDVTAMCTDGRRAKLNILYRSGNY